MTKCCLRLTESRPQAFGAAEKSPLIPSLAAGRLIDMCSASPLLREHGFWEANGSDSGGSRNCLCSHIRAAGQKTPVLHIVKKIVACERFLENLSSAHRAGGLFARYNKDKGANAPFGHSAVWKAWRMEWVAAARRRGPCASRGLLRRRACFPSLPGSSVTAGAVPYFTSKYSTRVRVRGGSHSC